MKRILSILSVATLFVLIGCTDSNDDMEIVYDSIIEPDFTVAAAEIVAGVTPVTFTNTTSVEGTTVAEYFWHFGFSGEGNWSEEAEPDPIVYNQAGEYTVTLTAWGADGNRATVKKVVTVLADNVVPTADFSYSPMMVNVGDEVTFSLGDVPAGVQGQISIDPVTGDVSAAKGHSIPMGVYDIPVKASNLKGEAETTLKLTVNENPYYFTTITYGNNLGLTPVENYANQFYFAAAADFTELTPTTDAKPGTKLSWSIKIKHQCSGTLIDSETGAITPKGFKSGNGGLVLVTATAGEGEVGETSITVPVFFSFHVPVSGVTVRYKPFVMQVNPRRGGTSVVPEITGVPNLSSFLLDYRRTFNYYNIGGPASHKDGTPAASTDTFLYQMWKAYYNSIGSATVGTGSKDPISYYVNTARLGSALAYVEPATKSVVVNANKWIDTNNVAANGAFIAQMTFVTDGNSGGINSGSQIFPIWIWFDEKF